MTISVTETALDIEKKAIKHCARRNPLYCWPIWIYCGVFLTSLAGFYVFWCTDAFTNYVISQLELRNGTRTFDWWQHPPINMEYRIHVFNYTNVEEFEAGTAKKLRVQDLGPYIYRETKDRVNIVMHENGTMTFQERKSYVWTGGRPENDIVVIPNVPLLSTIAFVRDLSFGLRFVTNAVLSSLQERLFINETVGGFIWGYDSRILQMAKPLMMFKQGVPLDKFGMLVSKNGLSKDSITIYTGSRGLDNLGIIDRVNGINNREIWGDEKCDRITGSDGTVIPPSLIKDTSRILYVYSQDMCRGLPFHFTEVKSTYGIPALRYEFTPDAFNYSDAQNTCFCQKINGMRVCPPAGLFNMSLCHFGTPMLSSFPHFYGADRSLLEQIDGLNPQQEDHENYVDLHPRLGTPIAGWSRLQINLEARKAIGFPVFGNLKDGTILPLFWMEIGIDEVSEPVLELLRSAHFTATNVERALKYCTLIAITLSLSTLIFCLWKRRVQCKSEIPRDKMSVRINDFS